MLLGAGLLAGAAALSSALAQRDSARAALSQRRSDLEDVQARIRDLQKDIARSEESRDDALDALRETEQSISTSQRRLRELADSRREAEAELARVTEAGKKLEASIRTQQAELENLLRRYYVSGQAQGLRHMLSGSDPNQLARDLYYLKQLSRSEADQVGQLRKSLAEQKTLLDQAKTTRDALAEIEAEEKSAFAELAEQQKKRKAVLATLSDKLRSQRREVGGLKRDETRLTKLVDGLAELARKQAAAAEKARRQAQIAEEQRRQREAAAAAAAEAAAAHAAVAKGAAATATAPSLATRPVAEAPTANPPPATLPKDNARKDSASGEEPVRPQTAVAKVEQAPQPLPGGTPFADLRGRLRLPVKGELMNRFGSPRADGGSSWRGVFIRSASGAEVRAVAGGRVAFADWLRGFGNLVIVDHGDGYLSIYGYNESLLRSAGEIVRAGDSIASVGNSGGSQESGLYFELRHRGQPIDPLRWVSLK